MRYFLFILLKFTTVVVVLNFLSLLVINNCGIKAMAASTGRAFEYDSFPTDFDKSTGHSGKGFGVPRIIPPSSVPACELQIVPPIVGPGIRKEREISNPKGSSHSEQ